MLFSLVALAAAKTVVTFGSGDGAAWQTVNDPVMGGVSESSFFQGDSSGIWKGKVEIVPFLKKPGFCSLRTPGLHECILQTLRRKTRSHATRGCYLILQVRLCSSWTKRH